MTLAARVLFWGGLAMLAASVWAFITGVIGWGGALAILGAVFLFLRHLVGRTQAP